MYVNLISEFLSRSRAHYTAGNLRFQPVSVCRPGVTASLTVQSYEEHVALANKTAKNTLFRPLFSPLFFAQKSAQEKTAHKKITPCVCLVHETDIRTSDFGRFGVFL